MLSIVWMWRKLTEITARICAHIKFNAFSRYNGKGLTFKVRGWLEAGEARCKPVPLHRNVRGYFETPTKLPARTKMLGLRREISCHSRVLG